MKRHNCREGIHKLALLPGLQSTRALPELKDQKVSSPLVHGPFIGLGCIHTWAAVRRPSQTMSRNRFVIASVATQGPSWHRIIRHRHHHIPRSASPPHTAESRMSPFAGAGTVLHSKCTSFRGKYHFVLIFWGNG